MMNERLILQELSKSTEVVNVGSQLTTISNLSDNCISAIKSFDKNLTKLSKSNMYGELTVDQCNAIVKSWTEVLEFFNSVSKSVTKLQVMSNDPKLRGDYLSKKLSK